MGIESSRLRLFANSNKVQNATGLAALLESLDVFDRMDQYDEVRELAPRRGRDGLRYFVDRIDSPVYRDKPGMAEDLLEMALVNDAATVEVNGGPVDVLMRQFPLFSKGSRRGVKAVDLVGHGTDRFWLIELKVQDDDGSYGETPLRALLECLIYGAVIEANIEDVRAELLAKYGRKHSSFRPGMAIAAPTAYWERWTPDSATGEWWAAFEPLAERLSTALDAPLAVIDLGQVSYTIDASGYSRLDIWPTAAPVSYRS